MVCRVSALSKPQFCGNVWLMPDPLPAEQLSMKLFSNHLWSLRGAFSSSKIVPNVASPNPWTNGCGSVLFVNPHAGVHFWWLKISHVDIQTHMSNVQIPLSSLMLIPAQLLIRRVTAKMTQRAQASASAFLDSSCPTCGAMATQVRCWTGLVFFGGFIASCQRAEKGPGSRVERRRAKETYIDSHDKS